MTPLYKYNFWLTVGLLLATISFSYTDRDGWAVVFLILALISSSSKNK